MAGPPTQVDHESHRTVPRRESKEALEELDDGEVDDTDDPDLFTSPVGGGGFIGKWLKKMLSSTRKSGGSGGGPPGADAPTHRTNSANRGAVRGVIDSEGQHRRCQATSSAGRVHLSRNGTPTARATDRTGAPCGRSSRGQGIRAASDRRRDRRAAPPGTSRDGVASAPPPVSGGRHRHRRRVEARVEVMAGSVPDEAVYLDSLRRRRDLSVLLLLDVSGSAAEPGTLGRTVHQQQRAAVASLDGGATRPG